MKQWMAALAAVWVSLTAWAGQPVFSAEERQWMAAHPQVEARIFRSSDSLDHFETYFLNLVSAKSGLRFEVKPLDGLRTDAPLSGLPVLMSGVTVSGRVPALLDNYRLSRPVYQLDLTVVSKPEHPLVVDARDLIGRRVAVHALSARYLAGGRSVVYLPCKTDADIVEAVRAGRADLGLMVATEAVKLAARNDDLVFSPGFAESAQTVLLAVRKDQPLLYAIVEKSLAQVTAGELRAARQEWADRTKAAPPSWHSIWVVYRAQVLLSAAALAVLLLAVAALLRANRARRDSEAAKSRFLAMMGHELRTPLGIVLASNELLIKGGLAEAQRQLVERADSAARSLLALLDNILDVSRGEAGRIGLDERPTRLAALLEDIGAQYRMAAEAKGLVWVMRLEGVADDLWLKLDDTRLRQMLHNLLSNALKFTREGEVRLTAAYQGQQDGRGRLRLQVADTGIGIAKARQAELFQPFRQADNSITRRFGGSGLGLSICKQLAEEMGGAIALLSEEGKGSEFTVQLPAALAQRPAAPARPQAALDEAVLSGPRLLLVEDHPANQAVIGQQLRALHLGVSVAGDAQAALALLDAGQEFDLALLDCRLPGMDGYQLAEAIRQREARLGVPALPLIALSAETGPAHQARCLEAGMNGTLAKPLSLGRLQDTLALWLDLPEPVASTAPADGDLTGAALWQRFIACNQQDLQALEQALAQDRPAEGAEHAHRIHGAARTLAAGEIADAAAALERALRGKAADGETAACLQGLRDALSRFQPPAR